MENVRKKSDTLARRISTAGAQEMQKNRLWTFIIAARSRSLKKEIRVPGAGMSAVVWSLALVFGTTGFASGQTQSSPDQTVYIRCGSLIDGKTGESRSNVTVVVECPHCRSKGRRCICESCERDRLVARNLSSWIHRHAHARAVARRCHGSRL